MRTPEDGEKDSYPAHVPPGYHRLIGHLAAFYYAAREGSIQGGARRLGLNRNSLARYLDELEHIAGGVRLRHPDSEVRGLDLTEAGRHLRQLLEPIFSRLETVATQLVGGLQDLRLGCQTSTSTYLLPGWLRAFEREAQESRAEEQSFRLSLKTGSSESILEALKGLEVDVGIVATEVDRERTEGGIAYVPLMREQLIAICPKDHPLARSNSARARDFVRHPQYLYYRGGERYQERINALATGEGARRQMEFDTIAAIKETVRAGLGVSIIPGGAVRREDREWLAVLNLEVPAHLAPRLTRVIAVVIREGDELTPLAREFLQFLQEHRKALAGT
ncbi:MAG: LysR family transcriptional regulator [Armatimonadetes bacterium]|nr:LysR family transcriptional regulator [Armatimonadota bacterium]